MPIIEPGDGTPGGFGFRAGSHCISSARVPDLASSAAPSDLKADLVKKIPFFGKLKELNLQPNVAGRVSLSLSCSVAARSRLRRR